jgi:hypothetical protein
MLRAHTAAYRAIKALPGREWYKVNAFVLDVNKPSMLHVSVGPSW